MLSSVKRQTLWKRGAGHAAVVAGGAGGPLAAGADGFPAQAAVEGPQGRDFPLVLAEGRQAAGAGLQVTAELGQLQGAVLHGGGALLALAPFQFPAEGQVVLPVEGMGELAGGAEAAVADAGAVPVGVGHGTAGIVFAPVGGAVAVGQAAVEADVELAAAVQAMLPVAHEAQHGALVLGAPAGIGIGGRTDALGELGVAGGGALVLGQEGIEAQAVAAVQLPVEAGGEVQSVGHGMAAAFLQALQDGDAGGQVAGAGGGGHFAVLVPVHQVGIEVVAEVADGVAALQGDEGLQAAVLQVEAGTEVVLLAGEVLPQDDVDGAGDGPGAVLRHRGPHHLDAFHLFGRDAVQGKAPGRRLAVEQDHGVAVAQAPHADVAATARGAGHGDARQTLQDVAHGRVAVAVQFLPAENHLGGRGETALLGVVEAGGGNHDFPQGAAILLAAGGFGCGGLCFRCGDGQRQGGEQERQEGAQAGQGQGVR